MQADKPTESYDEAQTRMRQEQGGMSREQIKQKLAGNSVDVFDPATAKPSAHNWVDRGEVLSCEGGAHPYHRAFKRR